MRRLIAARPTAAALALLLALTACAADVPAPTTSAVATSTPAPSASAPAPTQGAIEPAPGSESAVYAPNPGAIVVVIDPGHGGCLDWGVPDPSERGVAYSEKVMTLGIATHLRDLLEADGIGVVMTRTDDSAIAGDNYPPLGCNGPEWRDVNGDGESGFDPEGATRTRDELQARLDLANLAGADALVSIHINSPFDAGQSIQIAFTQTFYTDETPWGPDLSARLADAVQEGVVASLGAEATYDRGDRGITARNFYIVAPPLFEPTAERPDPVKQPTRGALMPAILSEVGSITLTSEQDLLVTDAGQAAVAHGVFDGLRAYFGSRELAARIGLAGEPIGMVPQAVAGDGPPFWAPVVPAGPLRLELTNTGTEAWPAGLQPVAGWEASDQPYLPAAPERLEPIGDELPALAPGESISLQVALPDAPAGRALAWISLSDGAATLADHGSPALQLSSQAP